jgi:protein MAK11
LGYSIKAVRTLEIALPPSSSRPSTTIACTVSSDGFINLYDIVEIHTPTPAEKNSSIPKQIKPLTSYDSKGTRFTCVTLADGELDNVPLENGMQGGESRDSGEDWDGEEDDIWGGVGHEDKDEDEDEE